MGKPKRKQGELVLYDPKRRTKIYRVRHHIDKTRFVYAGQTVDEKGRISKYRSAALRDRTATNAKRDIRASKKDPLMIHYVTERLLYREPLLLETCPEFPNGVPHERADGFEALMINDLETGANEKHGYGKNTSLGNNLGEHQPRFDEYRAELAASGGVYVWSEKDDAMSRGLLPLPVPEPPEVTDAEMKADALLDMRDELLDAEVPDEVIDAIDERIKGALVVVEDVRRQCLGPLALAEYFSTKYAAQLVVESVGAEEFQSDLNALRDKLKEAAKPDADLLGLCRAAELMTKRPVTAGFVAALFATLAKAIEAIEEAALLDSPEVKLIKEARLMMSRTGVPRIRQSAEGVLKEEFEIYIKLSALKRRHKRTADVASMRFILRSNPEWIAWFDGWWGHDAAAHALDLSKKLNEMLLEGYAHHQEPEFEGRKHWPCGARNTEMNKYYQGINKLRLDLKDGECSAKRLEACLAGLKDKWPERDAWWRSRHI